MAMSMDGVEPWEGLAWLPDTVDMTLQESQYLHPGQATKNDHELWPSFSQSLGDHDVILQADALVTMLG